MKVSRQATHGAVVTFRQFTRARYSVFASLHRQVRIGVLTVAMLASVNLPKVEAAQPCAGMSADVDADEHELREVTVTGSMAPLTALESARVVAVLSRERIEAAAVHTVNDVLKLAVGVDVRQRGGFGIQTDISIDGGTFDQITLLLNGVSISSPHTGHLAADFPVSISDIERIEVLEGAASRVYGASAFGGAINIVTRQGTPTAVEAGVHGGSYATFGADARMALRPVTLSASVQRSDGATANSDFTRGSVFLSGQVDEEQYAVRWQGGWSGKSYGANTFYSAAYPNQYERGNHLVASVGAETKSALRIRPELFWNRWTDNFELTRGSTVGENFHRTDVFGSRIGADIAWAGGRTAFGGEVREEVIYSTTLGRPLAPEQYTRIHGGDGRQYTNHDDRTNVSVSVEHTFVLPHFTASVGALANRNSYLDARFRLYPGVDLAYRPDVQWALFASYNKGFRLPTFTDLYYRAPTHAGNIGLRSEENHSFQLAARWRGHVGIGRAEVQAKGFYHRGSHMIDWVMYSPDDVYHSAAFDLDNMGAGAEASLQPDAGVVTALHVGYTYMHQHRRDDVAIYKSNYAMEYLRHKLTATLDHRVCHCLTASWSLRWQDRMGSYIVYADGQQTGRLAAYHPYATLDVKLRYTQPRYELWAEGTNITNHRYYDLGNIPQPGLLVMAGARVRF